MARTVNAADHAIRRDAFIDVAQRLIETGGYERMSIQDVLDELGASRGAFYHYFDSKAALLDAVVDRMMRDALATLGPLVADPDLTARAKLAGVWTGISRWKSDRTDLLVGLLHVWRSDENAIVREKFRRGVVTHLAPVLGTIIRQGVAEGFAVRSPDAAALVLISLIQGANETAIDLYLERQAGTVSFETVRMILAAYSEAFERVLGIPGGSLPVDPEVIEAWYGPATGGDPPGSAPPGRAPSTRPPSRAHPRHPRRPSSPEGSPS